MDTNGHTILCEDYARFEIAKLLKEKGFPEGYQHTNYFMDENGNQATCTICGAIGKNITTIPRPTHQMALKWLREVHNIYIDILTYTTGKNIQFRWVGYDKGRLFSQEEGKIVYFDSYKEAVEAALLYVLKNLI